MRKPSLSQRLKEIETAVAPATAKGVRHWIFELGAPALLLAIGFGMTGYTNFWLGFVVMTLAVGYIIYDFLAIHVERPKVFRLTGAGITVAVYAAVLWFVFVPAPLVPLITTPQGNFPEGEDIQGIQWKASYWPVQIRISNDTDLNYDGFDSYVRTNLDIAHVAIRGYINQCVASVENPYFEVAFPTNAVKDPSGKTTVVPLFQPQDQQTISTFYRIRCDKIAPHSSIDVIVAVASATPPDWAALSAQYVAANRKRNPFSAQCFVSACPDLPKSFENLNANMMEGPYGLRYVPERRRVSPR